MNCSNCPNCHNELKLEGNFSYYDVELDGISSVQGIVTVTFNCAQCSSELGEYDFDLDLDIGDFFAFHCEEEEHELLVELGDESYEEHTDDAGIVYPGVSATVKLSCICGSKVEYKWSNYDSPEDVIKELFSE